MESPSSTRRVTRSQTISKKIVECCEGNTNPRTGMIQKEQRALVDITNDSPIVGLAKTKFLAEMVTPSSELSKKRVTKKVKIGTPGSGEALLRAQVRTLLEKVEEEAEFSKICRENRALIHLRGFIDSPLNILAPANTPQIPNLSSAQIMELAEVTPSLVEDKLVISQVGSDEIIEERKKSAEKKDLVSRSLLFEFIEKLDGCDSDNDDDVSVWSLEVNVSSSIKDEVEDDDDEDGIEKSVNKVDEEDGYEDVLSEVCEGLRMMKIVKKSGKHTRFLYDSDEESGLDLNGLSKSEGNHIRFDEEEGGCSDEE